MRRVATHACLGVAAAALAMGGCAAGDARSDDALAPSAPTRVGLAIESWVIRDGDHAVARVFADLDAPPTWLDSESAALWRENGLRVLAVPIERVASLRASLPVGGPSEVRELGEATAWTPIATGADLADRTLKLDSGLLDVGPGNVRLLVRSWIEPAIESAVGAEGPGEVVARVRIELAPQHAEPLPERSPLQIQAEREPTPVDRGQVFDRLVLSLLSDGSEAIVLIGESPAVDWAELASEARAPEPSEQPGEEDESEEGDPAPPDDRVEFPVAGPSVYPTLGEAMLNGSSYAAGSSPLRVVVVLVASPPADFALLNP